MTDQFIPFLFQSPIITTSDHIPVIIVTPSMEAILQQQTKPVRWLDERIYCKHARNEDITAAVTCPERRQTNESTPYCALTGRTRCLPCVFDEPENSTIWQRIRASVKKYQDQGWIISPPMGEIKGEKDPQ